jgi:MFS family permease
MSITKSSGALPWWRQITRPQWTALGGTTLGWGLEGFDVSLYTLILVPAVTDLLGKHANPGDVRFYSGLGVAVFLLGWALGAVLFSTLADRFGRVKVLTAGILVYAIFTAAAALAQEFWQLAALRFLAGAGSGVETPVGAALIAETWNNRYRARATGVMMSGYAGGYFLASLVYGWIGFHGWRVTLLVALAPALIALAVRRRVREPELTHERRAQRESRAKSGLRAIEDRLELVQLFTPPLLRRTLICVMIQTGALVAFWSVTTWTPQIITQVAHANGDSGKAAIPLVSHATAMLNLGGILGYASWGFIADAIGRRRAFAISFLSAAVGIALLFPFHRGYNTYLWLLPLVGFGIFGALSGPSVYFPELFGAGVRATAIAVTNSVGRILTAVGPLVAGSIVITWFGGDLGQAVTVVAGFLVVGLIGAALTAETRGRQLPEASPEAAPSAAATSPSSSAPPIPSIPILRLIEQETPE